MITGTHGIFKGGEVAIDAANNRITLAATTLVTTSGRNVGIGGDGRRIGVSFGAATPGFSYNRTRLSALDAPTYTLAVGLGAGAVFLVYDSTVVDDIVITGTLQPNDDVFASVSWPVGASSMADLVLDFSPRTETRVISATDPLSASDLYSNGMRFGDAGFNQPLASMGVMSEVLQGELRARAGDHFAVSLLVKENLITAGSQLTVQRFPLYLRDVVGGADIFRVIDTKLDAVFSFNVALMANQRINVFVDRVTGEVGAGTSFDPVQKVLVAFGDVPVGSTSTSDVFFVIASQQSQVNAQSGASIELNQRALPSGFAAPVRLSPVIGVPNGIAMDDNLVEVAGVQAHVAPQQAVLPDAPPTGDRLDFLFLEVHRVVEQSPPTDGSTYVILGGVGYLVTKVRLGVVADVDYDTPERIMLQPQVLGLGGGGFVADPQGHFTSPYFAVAHDGFSWALPVGLVYRFNQHVWAPDNLAGGSGRPDGKSFSQLGPEEIMDLSPLLPIAGTNHQALLYATVDAIMKGRHPQQFGQADLSSSYRSKFPLHVDAIAPTAVPGARMLGAPDGARRQWSAMPTPYWSGAKFPVNTDYNGISIHYEDGARTIMIEAPTGGTLVLEGGQPITELVWVETNCPVALIGAWALGGSVTASGVVDPSDGFYLPTGTISASFQVVQQPDTYLAEMPARDYGATIDGMAVTFVPVGQTRANEVGGAVKHTSAIGPQLKGDAVIDERFYIADGSDAIAIPVVIDGMAVVGVVDVLSSAGISLGVRTLNLGSLGHVLHMGSAQPNGTQVTVRVALAGRVINYDPKHLGLSEFAEAQLVSANQAGGTTDFQIALPNEGVLKGIMGYKLDPARSMFAGLYVDDRLYQATVTGFDRNLVHVTLVLTSAEYAALEVPEQAKWTQYTPGLYRLVTGTYTFTLPVLTSSPIKGFEHLVAIYDFAARPFIPLAGGEVFTLAHHGRLLITNTSAANSGSESVAPLTERFPLVHGTRKGAAATHIETAFSDVLELGQRGDMPWDGVPLELDGRFIFNAGIFDPDAGFAVWMCLVKDGRRLRVLTYVVEGDTFSVDTSSRGFLTYPLTQLAE